MTTRQVWIVVIGLGWVLLGVWRLSSDMWAGVASIALGVLFVPGSFWDLRRKERRAAAAEVDSPR